jgi:RHS repeat-associated protein
MGNRIAKHVLTSANVLESSTYYILDAQGNVMSTYEREIISASIYYSQKERYIYGSSRLGLMSEIIPLYGSQNSTYSQAVWNDTIGKRSFELSNHLGNVLSVISDKVIPYDDANDGDIDWFLADIRQSTDYSAFGVQLENRNLLLTGVGEDYSIGFNGMLEDDEIKGDGNSYDFGARMLDSRLGRWLSIDPFFSANPTISPYSFASNTPIQAIDKGGLYTIFVNGYIYNKPNTPSTVSPIGVDHGGGFNDDLTTRKPYWQGSQRGDKNEFINAAHDFFGDGIGRYVNGTGDDPFSTAEERQEYGRTIGKSLALQVKEAIKNKEDVKEINFVLSCILFAYSHNFKPTILANA